MPSQNSPEPCPACERATQLLKEKKQAAGVAVFLVTLLSCGMLMPITLPLTLYLLILAKSKSYCPTCRSLPRDPEPARDSSI